jgi:hypothetical protein
MEMVSTKKYSAGTFTRLIYPGLILIISSSILYRTSFPTTDWWNSGFYASCAYTLGIPNQGDSILYVILGRTFVVLMPFLSVFKALTLVNIVATAGAAICLYYTFTALFIYVHQGRNDRIVSFCAFVTAISIPFLYSVWSNSLSPNGYAPGFFISSLLLLLSVKVLLAQDELLRIRLILLISFVMGIDCAAHRLNNSFFAIAPVIVLYSLRNNLLQWKFWAGAVSFFAIGISLHMYLMIRGSVHPAVDHGFVYSWNDLVSWIRMDRFGEANIPMLFHRRAPLWAYQIKHMYLRYFGWNFIGKNYTDSAILAKCIASIPLVVSCWGIIYTFAKKPRAGLLLLFAFIVNSLFLIFYLNIWDNFFREIDRLFLASFLLFFVWTGIGLYSLFHLALWKIPLLRNHSPFATVALVVLCMALLPVNLMTSNWKSCDKSRYYFAEDSACNLLNSCDKNALLFTNGDNDTYPLWFCQTIKGIRRDVTVINLSLLNLSAYTQQISRRLPAVFASIPDSELVKFTHKINHYEKETSLVLPKTGLKFMYPGKDTKPYVTISDQLIIRIIEGNRWTYPIYFSSTVDSDKFLGLTPYLSLCGIVYKLAPAQQHPINIEVSERLFTQIYRYRNFNDSSVWIEKNAREQDLAISIYSNYRGHLLSLCNYYQNEAKNRKKAQEMYAFMNEKIPCWRFTSDQNTQFSKMEPHFYQGGRM